MVSITYGHGFLNDMNSATYWGTKNDSADPLTSVTITSTYDDYITISGTANSANDEYVYYRKAGLSIPSSYTKFYVRWRTSVAAGGLGAQVVLTGATGSQNLLGSTPQFSTYWTVTSGTINAIGAISSIDIYADDYPNTVATGPFTVSYDFILLCKNSFTFPNTAYGLEFLPSARTAVVPNISRVTDATQMIASESAKVEVACDLNISNDTDDWKRPQGISKKTGGDVLNGQVFLDIAHNSDIEPFQWLDTGSEQFKVRLEDPRFDRQASENEANHKLWLNFREYRRSSGSNESYIERFGLNL